MVMAMVMVVAGVIVVRMVTMVMACMTVVVPFVPERTALDPDKRAPWMPAEPRQD